MRAYREGLYGFLFAARILRPCGLGVRSKVEFRSDYNPSLTSIWIGFRTCLSFYLGEGINYSINSFIFLYYTDAWSTFAFGLGIGEPKAIRGSSLSSSPRSK